jgi:hypothetical protein
MREDGREDGEDGEARTQDRRKPGNAPGDGGERDGRGRFAGRSGPTVKQVKYEEALTNGVTGTEAARLADYSRPNVQSVAAKQSVGVRTLIDRRRRRIVDQCAGYAVLLFRDILTGKHKPDRIQWEATQKALAMAGLDKPQGAQDASNTKPIHQMSLKELEAMAARIQSAKTVSIVPELDGSAVQVIEDKGEDTP